MAANAVAAASHAGKYGVQAWQAFKTRSPTAGKGTAIGIRENTSIVKEANKAPRQLTLNVGKTGGRNSAGRITIFHRGGGAKRLHRRIDLKRSTLSMGVVERIEYDPNRSSRIALVRWVEGGPLHFRKKFRAVEEFVPPQKILEPTTTTMRGLFSLSSLSREGDQRKVVYSSPGPAAACAVVGHQTGMSPGLKSLSAAKGAESKKTSARDVFLSTFSTPRAETASLSLSGSLNFPRIAVAGARPAFFAPQMRDKDGGKSTFSLSEVRKWNSRSSIWAHRMKRKAAVSWQSFKWQDTLGFVGAVDSNESIKDRNLSC
ncbi:hypothetical protein P3X46_015500 [Hevea brasiliensis]|uniref:Large ribosomal subunit protein uL2 RNA-binding domain-containing protein n=1 Tax=Hevea brasiliensis TaxID=3981 RepID=A0ABQ9LYJ7_HEVBR|nr:60S ribosomal protein L2, mitochondrial [Hevea brasiliensis]KAJ9172235.1 hypothetical protein P3X46_015500 [Hevea brasiliensis]